MGWNVRRVVPSRRTVLCVVSISILNGLQEEKGLPLPTPPRGETMDPTTRSYILGEGRSSLVIGFCGSPQSNSVWRQVVASAGVVIDDDSVLLAHECGAVALRVYKAHGQPEEEPTVTEILAAYASRHLPLRQWDRDIKCSLVTSLEETSAMRDAATANTIVTSSGACLLANFCYVPRSLSSSVFRDRDESLTSTTIEIKPKGIWEPPRYGAARWTMADDAGCNQGDVRLHALKRIVCRFSMMQRWKALRSKQQVKGEPPHTAMKTKAGISSYCPNRLLLPYQSVDAMVASWSALLSHPHNNWRVVDGDGSLSVDVVGCIVSHALNHCDLRERLCSLQSERWANSVLKHNGNRAETFLQQVAVLDVELLAAWERQKRQETCAKRFELFELPSAEKECGCQNLSWECVQEEKVHPSNGCGDDLLGSWSSPPWLFDEAQDRFYVATTARDVSVLLTVTMQSTPKTDGAFTGDVLISEVTESTQPTNRTLDVLAQSGCTLRIECTATQSIATCRVAVVDMDCKRHKPIQHYLEQDRQICRAAMEWHDESHVNELMDT